MKNKPTQNIEKIIRFQIERNLKILQNETFCVFRPLCNENCCKAKWKIFCAVNTFWCVFCKLWVWALDFYENTFRNHFIGQKIAELRANMPLCYYILNWFLVQSYSRSTCEQRSSSKEGNDTKSFIMIFCVFLWEK